MLELEPLWGGGIYVADYVMIGAGSVLTRDVLEDGVVVAGVPARILRKITEQERQEMQGW